MLECIYVALSNEKAEVVFNRPLTHGTLVDISTNARWDLASVTLLGRNSECQVQIEDQRVSRRHAMIRHQDDGFWFFDLGSFNGSLLNGTRVTTALKLRDGDTLELADHIYLFEQQGDSLGPRIEESSSRATTALIRSQKVVILVSDIRGFTGISESLPLDVLARTIGRWYSDCDQVLTKHGATVDKFIGDSVLAYWTSIAPKQRLSALKAARDLIQACNKTYEERHELFEGICHDFSAGVALHLGEVAYGGMSQGEFTLVGDSVNLTFRLESLTKTLSVPVLATDDFFESWPEGNSYRKSLGAHNVKGRDQPVDVCAIKSFPEH